MREGIYRESLSSMEKSSKTVILAPGPAHLFWTTSVYYVWELSKAHSVVLVVDEGYLQDALFQEVARLPNVVEVLYIPKIRNIFTRHRFYLKEFKKLIEKHDPVFVFQHSAAYIENIYLFRACKKFQKNCYRICYQTGIANVNWEAGFKRMIAYAIENLKNQYKVPTWIARLLYRAYSVLKRWMNYYITPVLLTGRFFDPYFNIYTYRFNCSGEALKARLRNRYDLMLIYDQYERQNIAKVRGFDANVFHIAHPIESVGDECNRVLYRSEEESIISIFPTYGFSSFLSVTKGISEIDIEEEISNNWISAVKVLSEKFPGYRFLWKLHPAAENNTLMRAITEHVERECKDMVILPPAENAQKLVVKSRVVVTDASSISCWASLLKSKIAVCLDIFSYSLSDYENVDGVLHFDSLDALASFDFRDTVKYEKRTGDNLPTLTDFVNGIMKNGIGASL